MNNKLTKRLGLAALLAGLGAGSAFGDSATGTTNLQVTVAPEASIVVDTATTPLTSSGIFGDYTGTTGYTYKIRTTQSTGSGSVVLQISSDFAPTGGPSVGSPVNGDTLSYTCTTTAPATACSGSQTSSTSTTTPVASFGADAHSLAAGTSGNTTIWDLTNDPAYQTGSYQATATYTIAAL